MSQFNHTQNLHSNYPHGREKRVTSWNVWTCEPIYIQSIQFKFVFLNVFVIYLFLLIYWLILQAINFKPTIVYQNSV